MNFSSIVVLIYGALLFAGGLIGFLKAHSHASLVMGAISALVLIAAGLTMVKNNLLGFWIAIVASILLTLFFGYRFYATQKMMPSGMMAIISFIVVLFLAILQKTKVQG